MAMRFPSILSVVLMLAGALFSTNASAGEIRMAVATLLAEPMRAIVANFEKDTGNKVTLTVGNTSALLQQIIDGAEYDVIVPNNNAALNELEKRDLLVPGTRYTFATNALLLWSPVRGYVDANGDVLTHNKFDQLSIVSPSLVYGRPAQQVLDNLGLAAAIAGKLVERHDIAQSQQFITSDATGLGIVTRSQVYANGKLARGSAWVIPQSLYDPITQQMAILSAGRDNPAARSFQFYLKGSKAGSILLVYGYGHQVVTGTF